MAKAKLKWEQWKKDNHITINKMIRIVFPFGIPERRYRLARQRPIVMVEDEENLYQ